MSQYFCEALQQFNQYKYQRTKHILCCSQPYKDSFQHDIYCLQLYLYIDCVRRYTQNRNASLHFSF